MHGVKSTAGRISKRTRRADVTEGGQALRKKSIAALCRACTQEAVNLLLDLGAQPPSNRFLNSIEERVERHPSRVGLCGNYGLLQFIDACRCAARGCAWDGCATTNPRL